MEEGKNMELKDREMQDMEMQNKEMQEKLLAYRMLDSRLKGLVQQRELVAQKILEIRATIVSIEEAMKSKGDVLFSLGSQAHVHGEIKNRDSVIVEVGAGIALERTPEQAKTALVKRMGELEAALQDLQRDLSRVSSAMSELQEQFE